MLFLVLVAGIIFTIISTAILAYVSVATMIGPWIAPTIVLLVGTFWRLGTASSKQRTQNIALIQAIGAGGGIVATGIGFALPMLFFLDPHTFNQWLSHPIYFCSLVSVICLVAGGLGIWFGHTISHRLLTKDNLPFPVSQLTVNTIESQAHTKQAGRLWTGVIGTSIFCFLRDGFLHLQGLLPKTIYLFPRFVGQELAFSLSPMLWALGFTTGLSIALPLLVGMLSKYAILYPLNHHAAYLPVSLFPVLSPEAFTTAFCCGLVLCEIVIGWLGHPRDLVAGIKRGLGFWNAAQARPAFKRRITRQIMATLSSLFLRLEPFVALLAFFLFFSYFKFSIISQITLFALITAATYYISIIGGKIGQVQLGRFSTFVMIPMILIFKPTFVQLTMLCVFFHVCAATATDLLFDYKTAQLCDMEQSRMHKAQWLGLLVTALCAGVIFWIMFTHLHLGTAELFAQRGKTKALLIQTLNFNYYVIACGFLFGLVLKKFKISPTMTLGGIIMPNTISISLILGGLCTLFIKNKERYLPFCSGVFAYEALWIMISVLAKLVV